MSLFINPLDEDQSKDSKTPPSFFLGKYIVTKIGPPRDKTLREGMTISLALLSYENGSGQTIETISLAEGPNGYIVDFPQGKTRIKATKYRGPKSWYSFYHPVTGKRFTMGTRDPKTGINNLFTVEFVEDYYKQTLNNWSDLPQSEKDQLINEFLENKYLAAFARDFNLKVNEDDYFQGEFPVVGMVTNFYHEYTPPVGESKWGNVIATKYSKKGDPKSLPGDYEIYPIGIAQAINDKLAEYNRPDSFMPVGDDVI